MNSLNNSQKELIIDYFFGLLDDEDVLKAKKLIEASSQADEIYQGLQSSLAPLSSLEAELCPEELVESTISRVNKAANVSQARLVHLLEQERSKLTTTMGNFWRNFTEVAAIAAMILIVAGVSIPTLRSMRHVAWQTNCQAQLSGISRGFSNYSNDHQGGLPAVAVKSGAPWWKVGYQGKENHSNTRHLWLLVKGDYVEPDDFVCPGRAQGRAVQFDKSQIKDLMDFPARRYVTYSFKLIYDKTSKKAPGGETVLMADLNPVFEKMFEIYRDSNRGQAEIVLKDILLKINSLNHNNRGQNIMLGDGAVRFVKTRKVGTAADDIFTVMDKSSYRGIEVPSCDEDVFLAP